MIVNESAINQMTVESKLRQVPLRSSTLNHIIMEVVKGPEIKGVKLFIKPNNRPNLFTKC